MGWWTKCAYPTAVLLNNCLRWKLPLRRRGDQPKRPISHGTTHISFHGFSWWIYYESRRDTHRTVKQVSTTRLLRSFKIYLDSPYDPLCWRINQHLAQKSTSHAAPTLITGRPNGPTFAQGRGKGTGLHHQPGWVFAALCCAICAIYVAMWLWTKTFDHFFFRGGSHFHVHPIITGLDPTKPWWESTSIYFLCCEKVLRCFWPCVSSVWSPFCSLEADSKRSNSTSQGHKSGALAIMCAFEKKLSRAGSHRSQPWFPSPCFVG